MRARDKYEYYPIWGDFSYKLGNRMARVCDELLWEPCPVKVTFYTNDIGVWLIHHEETGFEFAHEAFERGAEWVEDRVPEEVALAEWMNSLAREVDNAPEGALPSKPSC